MFPNDPPGLKELQDRHERNYRRANRIANILLAISVASLIWVFVYAYFYLWS